MDKISELQKEHSEIKGLLSKIENSIDNNVNGEFIVELFDDLDKTWNRHEKREEKIFNKIVRYGKMPFEKMLLNEHRELRGHWKVLRIAMDPVKKMFRVALDTDGRMLIRKLKEHIAIEDK